MILPGHLSLVGYSVWPHFNGYDKFELYFQSQIDDLECEPEIRNSNIIWMVKWEQILWMFGLFKILRLE